MRPAPPALSTSGFGSAWFALCVAFALHIFDEATTGFLAVYNPTVTALRESWGWFPMPILGFREWLLMLIVACGPLFFFSPIATRGIAGLRPLAGGFCCSHVSKRPGAHSVLDPRAHGFVRNLSASRPGFLLCPVSVRGFDLA